VALVQVSPPCLTLPELLREEGEGEPEQAAAPPVVLEVELTSRQSQPVRVMLVPALGVGELVDQDFVLVAGRRHELR
jgi:hypothetical protein